MEGRNTCLMISKCKKQSVGEKYLPSASSSGFQGMLVVRDAESHGARWFTWHQMEPSGAGVQAEGISSANCGCVCCMCGLCPVGTAPCPLLLAHPLALALGHAPLGPRRARVPAAQSWPLLPAASGMVTWCSGALPL